MDNQPVGTEYSTHGRNSYVTLPRTTEKTYEGKLVFQDLLLPDGSLLSQVTYNGRKIEDYLIEYARTLPTNSKPIYLQPMYMGEFYVISQDYTVKPRTLYREILITFAQLPS